MVSQGIFLHNRISLNPNKVVTVENCSSWHGIAWHLLDGWLSWFGLAVEERIRSHRYRKYSVIFNFYIFFLIYVQNEKTNNEWGF